MFDRLYDIIDPLVRFTRRERHILEAAFTFRQVPRRFTLVGVGEVAQEVYFVHNGLLRLAYLKEGEERSAFFFPEGYFATSFESLLTQTPSVQLLDTLEPSDLLVLSGARLEALYVEMPKMNILMRKLLEQRFIHAQQAFASCILDTPERRYRQFASRYPGLLQRVPQHLIASFLGVTPVSLSRIRNRIMRQARQNQREEGNDGPAHIS